MSAVTLTPAARAALRAAIDARRRLLVADYPGEQEHRSRQSDAVRRHGTEAAYTRHGCRCDDCRAAANRGRAARRRKSNPAVHGTWSAYSNGCRCDDCRAAAFTYNRARP